LDNDGDGLLDMNDPDCSSPTDKKEGGGGIVEIAVPQGRDGVDNDGDGFSDLSDVNCDNSDDDSEGAPGTGVRCSNIISKNQKDALQEHAVALTQIAQKAGRQLTKTIDGKRTKQQVAGSLKRIVELRDLVFETTLGFPDVTVTCPGVVCSENNNFTNVERLKGFISRLRNLTKRLTARRYFRGSGFTVRNDPLVVTAKKNRRRGNQSVERV
jgi:hypothetical protein